MGQKIQHKEQIPLNLRGLRVDQALASIFPQYSRSRLQSWLKDGNILINNVSMRPKDKIFGGETIEIQTKLDIEHKDQPQDIPLNIVYEDGDILVINKPSQFVVHPGAGNKDNTLLNALLHHESTLATLPRAGIVHRLDKDTSGLLVIAKNLQTHQALIKAMQERLIKREYEAIVEGTMTGGGTIDQPIGRHPKIRTKMAVTESGKPSVTHYKVIKRFSAHTYISVILETGRTHQIRVHMGYIHHPIVGDTTYGARKIIPKNANEKLKEALQSFKRQALHAKKLTLIHPKTKKEMTFEAPLPEDMQRLLSLLEKA